jgi:hypothetical protein
VDESGGELRRAEIADREQRVERVESGKSGES